jgi:hypothetical protein
MTKLALEVNYHVRFTVYRQIPMPMSAFRVRVPVLDHVRVRARVLVVQLHNVKSHNEIVTKRLCY